jgi:ribbon-helix-helix CopG family protein
MKYDENATLSSPLSLGSHASTSCLWISGERCITLLLNGALLRIASLSMEAPMTARPRKAIRLTVSLDAADYDALALTANEKDVSLSWVIRQAVRQFVQREKRPRKSDGDNRNAGPSN